MPDDYYLSAHGAVLPIEFVVGRQQRIVFMAPLGRCAYGNLQLVFTSKSRSCANLTDVSFDDRVRYIERELDLQMPVYTAGDRVHDMMLSGSTETDFLVGVFKLPLCTTSAIHKPIKDNQLLSAVLRSLPEGACVIVSACRTFAHGQWTSENIGRASANPREGPLPVRTRSLQNAGVRNPATLAKLKSIEDQKLETIRARFYTILTDSMNIDGTYIRITGTRSAAERHEYRPSFIRLDGNYRLNFCRSRWSLITREPLLALELSPANIFSEFYPLVTRLETVDKIRVQVKRERVRDMYIMLVRWTTAAIPSTSEWQKIAFSPTRRIPELEHALKQRNNPHTGSDC